MKRIKWGLIILTMGFCLSVQSQPVRNKIKSLKVAFLTEKLSLTTDEAQLFWPVYNKYEGERQEIQRKERRRFIGIMADIESMNDGEAELLLQAYQKLQKDKYALENSYINELEKVLSARKIIILFQAEEAFKRRLLKQYRENRRN